MKKIPFLLTLMILSGIVAFGQVSETDSGTVKFAPGTLVGKYYGTYDTTSKKPDIPVTTQRVAGINAQPSNVGGISNGSLAPKQQLKVNQNFDPVEVSGTTQAGQLDIQDPNQDKIQTGQMISNSSMPEIKKNAPVMPASEPVVAGQPETSYQLNRLGSSSPQYSTYEKNRDGAGAITTNPNKTVINKTAESRFYMSPQEQARKELGLLSGSSATQNDTYQKNDDGFGAVTNNPNKGVTSTTSVRNNIYFMTPQQEARMKLGLLLGSSAPQDDTYQKNDYGFGAVTNNPNKAGINSNPVNNPPIADSTRQAALNR